MKSYRAWNPGQSFLLPPSPLEWLPEGHLAYFVLELVETIDLSTISGAIQEKDARGERPYPPGMLVALLACRQNSVRQQIQAINANAGTDP